MQMKNKGDNGGSSKEEEKEMKRHAEAVILIMMSPSYARRLGILMGDETVRKVLEGAKKMNQPLGDALIMCIELLIGEKIRLKEK